MAKELEYLNLSDIAPPSIAGDKNVQDLFKSIDPNLQQVSEAVSEAFIIPRIKTLPEPVLDLLAWQWHVDFYELAKNIDAKREMVLGSIAWHRKKGTRWAIIKALEMLGVEAKFTAWYEEGADPYTFAIDAKLTHDFWERVDWTKPTQTIRRAIQESKAERSWMSRLYVYMEESGQQNICVGGIAVQGIQYEIKPALNTSSDCDLRINTGGLISQGVIYSISMIKPEYEYKNTLRFSHAGIVSTGAEINITMTA